MSDRRSGACACALAAVLAAIACSEADVVGEPSARVDQELLNATPTVARPEIVRLIGVGPDTEGGCTGTMLTGREFLTAAHCLRFGVWQHRGGVAWIHSPTMTCAAGCPAPFFCDPLNNACVEQIAIDRIFPQGSVSGASDLAVGRLTSLSTFVRNPALIALGEPSNTNLTVVGYGCDNRSQTDGGLAIKRFKTYFYQGQDSFNYCFRDSGAPTFFGTLLEANPISVVRVASAFTADVGTDVGADPVLYQNQLRNLMFALQTPGISYRGFVQNVGFQSAVWNGSTAGTTGQSLRLEGLQVWSATPGVVPCYRAHVQDVGWQSEVCDGGLSGTVGQNLRLEAFQIRLLARGPYSRVQYRAHVQDVGWQPFITEGQACSSNASCPTNLCFNGTCAAGTTGQSRRIEAVQLQLQF